MLRRHLRFVNINTACAFTFIHVGSDSSEPPFFTPLPLYGKRLREAERKLETTLNSSINTLSEEHFSEDDKQVIEAESKRKCVEHYGFVQKPYFMENWYSFCRELQSFELTWSLHPHAVPMVNLDIIDRFEADNSVVHTLYGNSSECSPIARMFEVCILLTREMQSECTVNFKNSSLSNKSLLITSFRHLTSVKSQIHEPKLDNTFTQYNTPSTALRIEIVDNTSKVKNIIVNNLSLLTFNYAFLTSIPIFLKRNDVGVRNVEFLGKEEMKEFRFAWSFLRRESCMTPLELSELDTLLPL